MKKILSLFTILFTTITYASDYNSTIKLVEENSKVIILDIQNKEPQKLINKLQGISENRGTALDILTKDYNISFEQQ